MLEFLWRLCKRGGFVRKLFQNRFLRWPTLRPDLQLFLSPVFLVLLFSKSIVVDVWERLYLNLLELLERFSVHEDSVFPRVKQIVYLWVPSWFLFFVEFVGICLCFMSLNLYNTILKGKEFTKRSPLSSLTTSFCPLLLPLPLRYSTDPLFFSSGLLKESRLRTEFLRWKKKKSV